MTDLVVRRLLVDMEKPIPRHWFAGDAFMTAFMNALSMSFQVGEQFFIDSVRNGFNAMPPEMQEKYRAEVKGFAGQEAAHRRLHALYNKHLDKQGLINEWEPRARNRLKKLEGADVRYGLAMTAANEHFTAIMADWMLNNPDIFGTDEPRLAMLWLWHSVDETEHRSTAFDIFHAMGGKYEWRVTWFRRITLVFLSDALRQTIVNLRCDGTLWKLRTWIGAAKYLFGKRGLVRYSFGPWRQYFRRDFHPSQHDAAVAASQEWLRKYHDRYSVVGG